MEQIMEKERDKKKAFQTLAGAAGHEHVEEIMNVPTNPENLPN